MELLGTCRLWFNLNGQYVIANVQWTLSAGVKNYFQYHLLSDSQRKFFRQTCKYMCSVLDHLIFLFKQKRHQIYCCSPLYNSSEITFS